MSDQQTLDGLFHAYPKPATFENEDWYTIDSLERGTGLSGSLTFDTSVGFQNDQFVDFSQSYCVIPYTATMTCLQVPNANVDAWYNDSMLALKQAGSLGIIGSVQIQCNGVQINLASPNQAFVSMRNYLDSSSRSTYDLTSPMLQISPDNANSYLYTGGGAGANAVLYQNNVNIKTGAVTDITGVPATTYNDGFVKRGQYFMGRSSAAVADAADLATLWLPNNTLPNTAAHANPPANSMSGVINVFLYIPLKLLHDSFNNMPIVKGLNLKIIINYNAVSSVLITGQPAGNPPANINQTFCDATLIGNGFCCPIMASSYALSASVASGGALLTALSFTPTQSTAFPARLYYKTIKLTPEQESEMKFPMIRTVKYHDHVTQYIKNIPTGQAFSWLVTPSQRYLRKIILMPHLSRTVNGASALLSCLTSDPFVASPIKFSNLNLEINGKRFSINAQNYQHQLYKQTTKALLNQCEDNLFSAGIASDWDHFKTGGDGVVFDLTSTPFLAETDVSGCSVRFTGTPLGLPGNTGVDLYCYLIFERSFSLEQTTSLVAVNNVTG